MAKQMDNVSPGRPQYQPKRGKKKKRPAEPIFVPKKQRKAVGPPEAGSGDPATEADSTFAKKKKRNAAIEKDIGRLLKKK